MKHFSNPKGESRVPDGKAKIAARKAWVIKYADILRDAERWERYLNGFYDYPAHRDAVPRERGPFYGGRLPR